MVDGNKIVDDWKKWKESAEKTEDEMVGELMEALYIDRTLKLVKKLTDGGFLKNNMTLYDAMCLLERRKFELIGVSPVEVDGDEDEPQ